MYCTVLCSQAALAEKASLIASVSGSQLGDDAASDLSDYETLSRRTPTPRSRRERDLSSSIGKDRKDDQIRTLEIQARSHSRIMLWLDRRVDGRPVKLSKQLFIHRNCHCLYPYISKSAFPLPCDIVRFVLKLASFTHQFLSWMYLLI